MHTCRGQPLATVLEANVSCIKPHATSSKVVQLTDHQQHTMFLCSLNNANNVSVSRLQVPVHMFQVVHVLIPPCSVRSDPAGKFPRVIIHNQN